MWYIIDREPGALIRCGFRSAVDPARLDTLVAEGRFSDCLGRYESAPGDVFFIPAGRVHSIGKGNLLCEIQESSDITYRIDDFNRRDSNGNLRELHLDLAKDAIDYSVSDNCRSHTEPVPGSVTTMVDSPFFITDLLAMQPGESQSLDSIDSFRIVVCLDGEVSLMTNGGEAVTLSRGHSARSRFLRCFETFNRQLRLLYTPEPCLKPDHNLAPIPTITPMSKRFSLGLMLSIMPAFATFASSAAIQSDAAIEAKVEKLCRKCRLKKK